MLEHLRAQNLGLIEEAEINPGPRLTAITGETGAGKTLLLGALRLLLGEPSDSSSAGPFADAAQADGSFVDDAGQVVVASRVVPKEGRSRAYLDGVIASAETLNQKLGPLLQLVGQHDQMELRKSRYVMDLLDRNLDLRDVGLLGAFRENWEALRVKLDEQEHLGGSRSELARELDLVRYQSDEISQAGFEIGDDDALKADSLRLRNTAQIKEELIEANRLASTIAEDAGQLVDHIRRVSTLDRSAIGLSANTENLAILATELNREIEDHFEGLVEDPDAARTVDQRLTLLGDLKMKYGRTVEEVLAFGQRARSRMEELSALLERSATIDGEVEDARESATRSAQELSAARARAADRIESSVGGHLDELGLEAAALVFAREKTDLGPHGLDHFSILFSSDPRLEAGPLNKVASGGELSRLILAISLATVRDSTSTLVFDEVDTGIGGATALAMGKKLASLAQRQQILCVTHLPQVAAFADAHYVITRSDNDASVRQLSDTDRLEELSRMIAGLPDSERGQQAALELLELGQS